MDTVASLVTKNWPTTEPTLVASVDEYPSSKVTRIREAIRLLWFRFDQTAIPPDQVDDQPDVVKQYVANKATLRLIRIARDFFKEGLISTSASVPGGGTSTESTYNHVSVLDQLRTDLEAECASLEGELAAVMGTILLSTITTVDIARVRFSPNNIIDPLARAKARG